MGELRYTSFYDHNEIYIQNNTKDNTFDKVQHHWEDDLVRFTIRPFLKELLTHKKDNIRILNIGAGLGQGFEILSKVQQSTSSLSFPKNYLLPEENIELFMGLDSHYEYIEKANEIYQEKKKVRFIRANYGKGLGLFKEVEAPFDIYFSGDGVLSHLDVKELFQVLGDVCTHGTNQSLLVWDFLGKDALVKKYGNTSEKYTFWTKGSLQTFIEQLQANTGVKLDLLTVVDRSILIASATQDRKYGYLLEPVREGVNTLLDRSGCTDLTRLMIQENKLSSSYNKKQKTFFKELVGSWNLFIQYALQRFEKNINPKTIKGWRSFSKTLQFGLMTLDRLIKDTEWIEYEDRRANIIEPHIAYVLRSLEFEMQKGLGCGQYLSAVLRIQK